MRQTLSSLVVLLVAGLAACGSDGSTGVDPNADPRCVALCTPEEPPVEGAGDKCSAASASTCVDQCEVRIAGVASVCQSCLLEEADFDTGSGDGNGDFCDQSTCTVTGRMGECTYPTGNTAMRDACYRQVNPRREVACEPGFRPVSECASLCG